MGTPTFSAKILDSLLTHTDYEIALVVSQPDRPVGRKQVLEPTAVKQVALEHNLESFQPESIATDTAIEKIAAVQADLILTVAYGQKIPKDILDLPAYGAINVHPSLLPKYRGGAPIHHAVKNGDAVTGVTIMYMVEEMDAGDIISQVEYPIQQDETTGELFDELAEVASELLIETLANIFTGESKSTPQDSSQVVYAPTIHKTDEEIDWTSSANTIHNLVRALNPKPGAYTFYKGKRLKIFQTEVNEAITECKPGQVINVEKKEFQVACGAGTVLTVKAVQPAGKKLMPVVDFLNGSGSEMQRGCYLGQKE